MEGLHTVYPKHKSRDLQNCVQSTSKIYKITPDDVIRHVLLQNARNMIGENKTLRRLNFMIREPTYEIKMSYTGKTLTNDQWAYFTDYEGEIFGYQSQEYQIISIRPYATKTLISITVAPIYGQSREQIVRHFKNEIGTFLVMNPERQVHVTVVE
jgi:hypothetical protein